MSILRRLENILFDQFNGRAIRFGVFADPCPCGNAVVAHVPCQRPAIGVHQILGHLRAFGDLVVTRNVVASDGADGSLSSCLLIAPHASRLRDRPLPRPWRHHPLQGCRPNAFRPPTTRIFWIANRNWRQATIRSSFRLSASNPSIVFSITSLCRGSSGCVETNRLPTRTSPNNLASP